MGLAYARFNGQRVYRRADVSKIAEKLAHYRLGNLPKRGRPKHSAALAHLPLEIKLAEIGLDHPLGAGGSVGYAMFSKNPSLSDDEMCFFAALTAEARADCLKSHKVFAADEVAEDKEMFLGGVLKAYRMLQNPPHPRFANMDATERAEAGGIAPPEAEGRVIAEDLYATHPMMDREGLLEHLEKAANLRREVLQERIGYALSEATRDIEIYVQTASDHYTALMTAGPSSPEEVN